ncbi:alpha/beta hydrolase fold domain-containing protein [Phthorimaea operculella]|nr:alpha/beta hydrolase fold domain-containing protein [Phthorimaea operculella]
MERSLKLVDFGEQEVSIQAPWGKLAAVTWGSEANPPVLLVHGKMDVATTFRPLVALLPRAFFYVSLECPGVGKSDQFPAYARYTTVDMVPAILAVKEHFKWERFIYIGHSLGVVIGKYFNLAYPSVITRMIELDPVPAHDPWTPDNFGAWYQLFYGDYYRQYEKFNGPESSAPTYTYEKALDMMLYARGLTPEAAEHVLERALKPAGDGKYRFSYDQRQREITRMPLDSDYLQKLYTAITTPTFAVLSQTVVDLGIYSNTPFATDESAWPNNNYRFKIVPGGHDVHINNPQCMAEDISKFMLEEFKSKL